MFLYSVHDLSTKRMQTAMARRALLLGALASVATVAVVLTTQPHMWVSLATAAELREITWVERSDMNPSNLAAKNDDGHTRMWDAAANLVKHVHHSHKAVSDQGRNFYGMPRFFAHSTGYVQDHSVTLRSSYRRQSLSRDDPLCREPYETETTREYIY